MPKESKNARTEKENAPARQGTVSRAPVQTPARAMSPFEEMERLFESVLPRRWRMDWPALGDTGTFEARMPRVDIVDREGEIVVRAEVPGVDKENLDISTTGDTVTIRGTTRHEEKEEREDYYRAEISRGSFSRTVALPAEVDDSKAKAVFRDGILELTLPKAERARRRRITVE